MCVHRICALRIRPFFFAHAHTGLKKFGTWLQQQVNECIVRQMEQKIDHCWPTMLWIRKSKSTTPMQGELGDIPLEELVSLTTAEPSLVEDSIQNAKWCVTVLSAMSKTLESEAFPLTRDGKRDNVHYHLLMVAPSIWVVLHKLSNCKRMDATVQAQSGIKQITTAEAELNHAISIIEKDAPAATLTKKLKATADTLKSLREGMVWCIMDVLMKNITSTEALVTSCLDKLPMSPDDITKLCDTPERLTEAEEVSLHAASQSVDAFPIHTHFFSNVKVAAHWTHSGSFNGLRN